MIISIRKRQVQQEPQVNSSASANVAPELKTWIPRPRKYDTVKDDIAPAPQEKTSIYLQPTPGHPVHAAEVERAIRRAGTNGEVNCAAANYEPFEISGHARLVCFDAGGHARVHGGLTVSGTVFYLQGFVVDSGDLSKPAITLRNATLICEDCDFRGAIKATGNCKVYMRNSVVESDQIALDLSQQTTVELVGTRVTGRQTGLSLDKNCDAALYACRFDGCRGADGRGHGIVALESKLYIEACEFFGNGISLGAKLCDDIKIFDSHFDESESFAIEADMKETDARFDIYGSIIGSTNDRPPIRCRNGSLRVEKSLFYALHEWISSENCAVASRNCLWQKASGDPMPLGEQETPQDELSGSAAGEPASATLERALETISSITGQDDVAETLGGIVRYEWGAVQQSTIKLRQKIVVVFAGTLKAGQPGVAQKFATALHQIGAIRSDKVQQVLPPHGFHLPVEAANDTGLFFYRVSPEIDNMRSEKELDGRLLTLIEQLPSDAALVIETQGNKLHYWLRNHRQLRSAIAGTVNFLALRPNTLAAHFAGLCAQENLSMTRDAARKLLILIHAVYEGLGYRYSDYDGIAELFLEVRRNYLTRSAASGQFHNEIEFNDINIPLHRRALDLCARSADFAVFCPKCRKPTPWLPGLITRTYCIHCGYHVPPLWGILRESKLYRHLLAASTTPLRERSGAVTLQMSQRGS